MATLIFVDKDNEEPGSRLASKDGLKLGSGGKYGLPLNTQVLSG